MKIVTYITITIALLCLLTSEATAKRNKSQKKGPTKAPEQKKAYKLQIKDKNMIGNIVVDGKNSTVNETIGFDKFVEVTLKKEGKKIDEVLKDKKGLTIENKNKLTYKITKGEAQTEKKNNTKVNPKDKAPATPAKKAGPKRRRRKL